MRIVFTFYFFLLSFTITGQVYIDSTIIPANPPKKPSDNKIRMRCISTQDTSSEPLVIIDGVPVEFEKMKDINPNNIESIAVLKDAATSAIYGCRAVNGVIIITTRSSKNRQFQIKDFLDGGDVAGATISFISARDKKDTLMFTANDSGMLTTDKLKAGEEYKVTITSTGYKPLSFVYKNISGAVNTFSLERDIINCDPVIVTAYGTIRCRRISCCGWRKISDCKLVSDENIINKNIPGAAVYPNPVQKGQRLTIEINCIQSSLLYTRVITLDGRQLLSQEQKTYKGINRFSVNIDSRLSAGVYFIQIVDDKGSIVKQEKIIIQ